MNKPLVSAILPVFNGELFIGRAVRSVLAQTYKQIEVIVIDDGSTDGTALIVNQFPKITYVFQKNGGVAKARNSAASLAQGEFIAFLDADDEWLPQKTEVQLGHHIAEPGLGYSVTMQRLVLDPGVQLPAWAEHLTKDHMGYFASTLLVRKSVFEKVGGFDPSYRFGDNADWFLRARENKVKAGLIRQTLLLKHIHDSNLSHHRDRIRSDVLSSFRNSVARRRAKAQRK